MPNFQDLISNIKLAKVLKGTGIAAASAGLTFFLGQVDVVNVDFQTTLLVTILATLSNALKVALTNYDKDAK